MRRIAIATAACIILAQAASAAEYKVIADIVVGDVFHMIGGSKETFDDYDVCMARREQLVSETIQNYKNAGMDAKVSGMCLTQEELAAFVKFSQEKDKALKPMAPKTGGEHGVAPSFPGRKIDISSPFPQQDFPKNQFPKRRFAKQKFPKSKLVW